MCCASRASGRSARAPEGNRARRPDGFLTQCTGCPKQQVGASSCESPVEVGAHEKSPKPFDAGLGDQLRHPAKGGESSGAGIRTPDTRIMIPLL